MRDEGSPTTENRPQWVCCQIGAREHYAVPRALLQVGRLSGLYTDFWAGRKLQRLAGRTGLSTLRFLASRFHPALSPACTKSWNWHSLAWDVRLRIRARRAGQYRGFLEVGQRFSIQVREALKKHSELKSESILFGYDTGALEVMEWGRERGMKCVLDQMDPSRVEADLVREEEERWPGWAQLSRNIPEEFFNRREKEWALADRVVVNSEFCREALLKQGVAAEKLVVVPLCYEPVVTGQRPVVRGPLRVLFLGQVVLRKGIQYLIEAARKLETESVCFDVVGPIGISQAAIASAPSNVHFCGRTSRNEAADWYQAADVFVLPTISDGFAITQLEAMAYGLPVIATPCCGAVVSHDVDGLIVPPRAPDALANAIQRYLDEPELLKGHGAAALVKSKQFSLERLVANLLKLEAELNRN